MGMNVSSRSLFTNHFISSFIFSSSSQYACKLHLLFLQNTISFSKYGLRLRQCKALVLQQIQQHSFILGRYTGAKSYLVFYAFLNVWKYQSVISLSDKNTVCVFVVCIFCHSSIKLIDDTFQLITINTSALSGKYAIFSISSDFFILLIYNKDKIIRILFYYLLHTFQIHTG
jgi:hypothetical protein